MKKLFIIILILIVLLMAVISCQDNGVIVYKSGIFLKIKNEYYIFLDEQYEDYEDRLFKIQPAINKENIINLEKYHNGNTVRISFATIGTLELPVIDVLSIDLIDDNTEIPTSDEEIINELIEKYKQYMY